MADKVERIEVFIARLKRIPRKEKLKIWSLCANEIRYLKNADVMYPGERTRADNKLALTSVRRLVSEYRNAVFALSPRHPALQYLKIAQADQNAVRDANRERNVRDNRNLRLIDPDEMIAKALALLEHKAYVDVVAGLLLLTGRRSIEVLKTGTFTKIRGRGAKTMLTFEGQAKTRGADSAQRAPYRIPVLVDPKIILEKIAWLRKTWPFDDFDHLEPVPRNKRIAQRTGKPLLQAVRFGYGRDLDPGRIFAPKDLRSAYAAIAYDLYAPDETTEVAYYAKILGHAETDIVTALSYLDFRTTLRTKRKATSLAAQSEKALLADLIARKNGASTPELADRIQEDIDTIAAVLARSKARRA